MANGPELTRGECDVALCVWQSVLSLIRCGTPLPGLEAIARYNIQWFEHPTHLGVRPGGVQNGDGTVPESDTSGSVGSKTQKTGGLLP